MLCYSIHHYVFLAVENSAAVASNIAKDLNASLGIKIFKILKDRVILGIIFLELLVGEWAYA